MRINIKNLIFQLLPVARRQPNRLSVLSALIDLLKTNEEYAIWQTKYSRILKANAQVMKLQRYLRDVFEREDIFVKERVSGKIRVALKVEKINNELIFGVSGETTQRLQLRIEGEGIGNYNYVVEYPKSIDVEKLKIEIIRFNPVMKIYKLKESI